MPEISIEFRQSSQDYKIKSEDMFWCQQGILQFIQLRESEDEQMIADIAASILLDFFSCLYTSKTYTRYNYNFLYFTRKNRSLWYRIKMFKKYC